MTEQELLSIEQNYTESKIQHTCVQWFRLTFPKVGDLLVAIPNGGKRDARTGAMMVYEGQVKGAADLALFYPSQGKATLLIEMKVPKRKGRSAGRQSEHQKRWEQLAVSCGNVYEVCHGLVEFIQTVCRYLQLDASPYIIKALNTYLRYL